MQSNKMTIVGTRNKYTAVVACDFCGQVYDTPISYKYSAPEIIAPKCSHQSEAVHPYRIAAAYDGSE
jgi:hypothetical protein